MRLFVQLACARSPFFFSFSSSLACTAFRGISRETLKLRQQLKRVEECFSPPSPPRFPRTRGREREKFPRLIEARKGAEASRDYTHATRPKQPYGGAKLKHTKRPERPTQSHTLARDYLFLEYITKNLLEIFSSTCNFLNLLARRPDEKSLFRLLFSSGGLEPIASRAEFPCFDKPLPPPPAGSGLDKGEKGSESRKSSRSEECLSEEEAEERAKNSYGNSSTVFFSLLGLYF